MGRIGILGDIAVKGSEIYKNVATSGRPLSPIIRIKYPVISDLSKEEPVETKVLGDI